MFDLVTERATCGSLGSGELEMTFPEGQATCMIGPIALGYDIERSKQY